MNYRDLCVPVAYRDFCTLFDTASAWHEQAFGIPIAFTPSQKQTVYLNYQEQHRCYHVAAHPYDMYEQLMSIVGTGANELSRLEALVVILAIIYHDVIYRVQQGSPNEALSNRMWKEHGTEADVDPNVRRLVSLCINASAEHSDRIDGIKPGDQKAIQHFLDLDLRRLAAPRNVFIADHELIIAEYASLYPEDLVRAGRRQWAQNFKQRPRLFFTDRFTVLETSAWENLTLITEGEI